MERQTSFTLPSPIDTPYRTPSSSLSRRSRDFEDMSPSSTPPPLPREARVVKKRSTDSQNALDESISPLDPRRFTPTLHASLVSEILSLRRELENKTKSIDQLEQNLEATSLQNDGLSKNLLASNKEIRSVKRQMQLLEGGTLSALNDLSKERDEATQEAADLRKRLDQVQKRAKSHEDNADRIHTVWEKDKESWATERRALETKAQIAENRLKAVLSEVAQAQVQIRSQAQNATARSNGDGNRRESRTSVLESPTHVGSPEIRRRRLSASSTASEPNGGRTSSLSLVNGHAINLADELALGDIEEDSGDDLHHEDGRRSPDNLLEEQLRRTSSLSIKANKALGLAFDVETTTEEDRSPSRLMALQENQYSSRNREYAYVDSAVQYSPPVLSVQSTHSGVDVDDIVLATENDLSLDMPMVNRDAPAMVSSSCQTIEYLPSPPLTPKQSENGLTTIRENAPEKVETKSVSTQTDVRPRPRSSMYIHSRTSTHDWGIPTIAIFPPTSRPVTPETNVVLPPQTRNASCQVDSTVLPSYTSSSMQTEEIRVERRNNLGNKVMAESSFVTQANAVASRAKVNVYSRHGSSRMVHSSSNSSLKNAALSRAPIEPTNDDGPLTADSALVSSRPIRSSSLFAGFDDLTNEVDNEMDDDVFFEDEYSTRPTAKFTLRGGKLVSQPAESSLEDINELSAASMGEAVALENLRRSEIVLPPELRQFDLPGHSKNEKRHGLNKQLPTTSKQASVRRAAMISNGVAAHQSRHSQSTLESGSAEGGMPPPLPIPLRYSSAKIGKSYSESGRNSRGSSHNTSPTRQYRHKYKPGLRKARSGPAISPAAQARSQRSKSPPLDSRISIVPEMPVFQMPSQTPFDVLPPLTNDLMNAPVETSVLRSQMTTGPRRSQGHVKQISDHTLVQQTSVVDAIAQTMVGEWMYKYVRRRKSFGKPEKDWDPNKSVEELTNNPSGAGVRHKRWVWLAPYERAVMWSSKQPMNGTALLGKSGRKLTVKSVLDVKDDNPMPKNALTGTAFNRSILVLTPQRALKFTATSQERHFVWLTALSFLSHSPLSIGDLAALPPPPDEIQVPSPPAMALGSSARRRTLRDSIRIAKGSGRQDNGPQSTRDSSLPFESLTHTRPSTRDYYDPEDDVAFPPTVRRFHTRNRSNTAPRPPTSVSSFSHRDNSSTSPLTHHAAIGGPLDRPRYTPNAGHSGISAGRRGSEASAFGRPITGNAHTGYVQPQGFSFSDSSHNASMTMRMDAFIENRQAGRGGFRNLKLDNSVRSSNKELAMGSVDENASTTVSPVDSLTPANTSMRLSDSTSRGSVDKSIFRAF